MREVAPVKFAISPMRSEAIDKVRAYEAEILTRPQAEVPIIQHLHAGVYTRVAFLKAGVEMAGAQIEIPTMLIVQGHAKLFDGTGSVEMDGFNVIEAAAPRKQALVALSDVWLTMYFATKAATCADAEYEFTNEVHKLTTRALCPE